MKIAIDGTACTGKSTFLKQLQIMSLPVIVGDYYEHCNRFPILKDKFANTDHKNIYTFYLTNKSIDGYIHDRCPISNIIYDWIIKILNGNMSIDEGLSMVNKYKDLLYPEGWFVIIWVTEEDEDIVINRMKQRNNGIDIFTAEYIRVQNQMFREVAKVFNFPLFVKRELLNADMHLQTLSLLIPIIRNSPIIYQMGEREIKTKPANDAGSDLTVSSNVVLLIGKLNQVCLLERVYIPKGFMGLIKERSSAAKKMGLSVVGGVIDAEYMGPLTVAVTVMKDSIVWLGDSIVQIVFIPIVKGNFCNCNVQGFATLRGENGWGSTGGYCNDAQ
ncbi:dUTPase [Popillia japonica]|uniref:Deoxyuridine 5'-triphosphate nucleotidohydrolase n=1 Tax=Popillia japonica TaxID=7064 RepID=A0AAW1IVK2_POPJA